MMLLFLLGQLKDQLLVKNLFIQISVRVFSERLSVCWRDVGFDCISSRSLPLVLLI